LRDVNEFDDHYPGDGLDRLLYRMPGELPSDELAEQICYKIHTTHRRALRVRLGLSFLLAVLGTWMALPGLIKGLEDLSLPSSGFFYLYPFIQSILNGLWVFTQNSLYSMTAFQENLAQTMGAGAWLGMVALASAALLALSSFIPQIEE
jgi:hypothetical protein